MNILDTIVEQKKREVLNLKSKYTLDDFKKFDNYSRPTLSLKKTITEGSGIIAEFKRKSPSKGIINDHSDILEITKGYENAGVSGISILTDEHYFGGSNQDLIQARREIQTPILRKDFIIDSHQIFESKAIGADVILLIARILTPEQTRQFTQIAHDLGLEVLLETHSKKEIEEHYYDEIDLVGINNRNLNSFEVRIKNSIELADFLPKDALKIAESGIDSIDTIKTLKENGFISFLMGEYFMKQNNPSEECRKLIGQLKLTAS